MKYITRMLWLGITLAALATLAVAQAQTDPLADYARSIRKDKKPQATKHYDNDNLPTSDKLSVVGNATDTPADDAAKADSDAEQKPSADEKQQQVTEWQTKIKEQKGKVDFLTRELDVFQREYRLRAAAFYADAGNRMRNAAQWDKEDAKYKQDLAQKQKALDDAKAQLDKTQEDARKAGLTSKQRE
ncbi:MAG: hypothetical protein JST79_01855 [Acidobacteria bacterium]|jgi:hypothetical protein|nr:hypothetical protein [Acidobacteriota bacterium]